MTVVNIPKILLPNGIDMQKWAVVACDQFTAEPKYWNTLENLVGDAPSTLRLVFPEIYLGKGENEKRVCDISQKMKEYLDRGYFCEVNNLILVERQVGAEIRLGLVAAIDLEDYDFKTANTKIRATEQTIEDRLPIRITAREKAAIELPHVLIIFEDDKKDIIEPLYKRRNGLKKLYDFELNMDGGHIRGYEVDNSKEIIDKIEGLLNPELQKKRFGYDAGFLLGVGDGNHSIAAAKVMWENIKKTLTPDEQKNHPARYALCELINLYGGGMSFDAIHRVVFGADESFVETLKSKLTGDGKVKLITANGGLELSVPKSNSIAIKEIQEAIEAELKKNPLLRVEYVHNTNRLREVVKEYRGIGIIMPTFPENELFSYVCQMGSLPKKAFSIGEPEHKRYYLEAKLIIK